MPSDLRIIEIQKQVTDTSLISVLIHVNIVRIRQLPVQQSVEYRRREGWRILTYGPNERNKMTEVLLR